MNYNYFTAPGHEVVCPDLSVFRELQTTQPQQQDSHVPLVPTPSVRARTARNKVSKRKQVKNACVNCQKACKKCDEGRPCRRCIKLGLTETCINSPRKERRKGVKRGPYKKRRHHQAVVILPTNDRQIKEIPIASISPNAPVPGLKPSLEYLGVRAASLLPQEPWCEPSYTVPQQETLSTLLSIDQIDSDSKDLQFNNNVVFTASSSTPSLSLSPLSVSDPLDLYGLGQFYSSLSPLSTSPISQTFSTQSALPIVDDLYPATSPITMPTIATDLSVFSNTTLSPGNSFYQSTDSSLLFPTSPTASTYEYSTHSPLFPSWSSSAFTPNLSQPIFQTPDVMLIQKSFIPWLEPTQTFVQDSNSWQSLMAHSYI